MNKRGLYYQLVKRQTEQNENEIKSQWTDNEKTTVSIAVPPTDKKIFNFI